MMDMQCLVVTLYMVLVSFYALSHIFGGSLMRIGTTDIAFKGPTKASITLKTGPKLTPYSTIDG